MIEIKFRCFYRGQMYQVHELCGESGMTVNSIKMYIDGLGFRVVSPDSEHVNAVMQYTGLKDKNGKEIYEGDVIQADNWNPKVFHTEKIIAPVVFMYGSFHLQTKAGLHLLYDTNGCEMIGNTYQNTELLNNGK